MTRRSAYLLTWGVAFLALGMFLTEIWMEPSIWIIAFSITGIVSIIASITKYKWIDISGFILLSMTSSARAVWFLWDFMQTELVSDLFGIVLWAAVAAAQVIVAGWPESRVAVDLLHKRETGGIE